LTPQPAGVEQTEKHAETRQFDRREQAVDLLDRQHFRQGFTIRTTQKRKQRPGVAQVVNIKRLKRGGGRAHRRGRKLRLVLEFEDIGPQIGLGERRRISLGLAAEPPQVAQILRLGGVREGAQFEQLGELAQRREVVREQVGAAEAGFGRTPGAGGGDRGGAAANDIG